MNGVGVALRTCEVGCRGARNDEHLILLARDFTDCESNARIGHIDDQVHVVDIEPLIGDAGADVGLVLMVGGNEIDLHVLVAGGEIGNGKLRGSNRAGSADIGIQARHVAEDTDLDLGLRLGACAHEQCGQRRCEYAFHFRHSSFLVHPRLHTPRYS